MARTIVVVAVVMISALFAVPAAALDGSALLKLQPRLSPVQVAWWVSELTDADEDAGIGDPLLLAAMVMRESSFRTEVADGRRRGALGEVGPLQVHGVALRFRPAGCKSGARCWLRAGARFLARRRQDCPGSRWRWVAAYGMRRCPTEAAARMSKSARRARALYVLAGGRWE